MAVVFTFHTGKAVMQVAAIEIAIDYLLDIGPPEAVLPVKNARDRSRQSKISK